jgi:hypothetical protein
LFRNQTVSLGIEKNGGRLFKRPKLTLSCSAEGKEGILYTVGRTPWTGDQPVAMSLPIHKQNKCIQTFMPRVGFEPTMPVFEGAKAVHVLHHLATVIGNVHLVE